MTTDSATLSIIMRKADSRPRGLVKEAGPVGLVAKTPQWVPRIGNAVRGWASKIPTRMGAPKQPVWRGVPHAVPTPIPTYPRIRPWQRGNPLQGNYSSIPGAKWLGGKLDNVANASAWGRAWTAPFRHAPVFSKGKLGPLGFMYGASSGMANRNLGEEMKAVGDAAAAEALIQQREWAKKHWMQNAFSPLASDQTVAQHIYKKNQPVGQAYWMQSQDRDYLANLQRKLTRNHGWTPWTSFWGGNKLPQPNAQPLP